MYAITFDIDTNCLNEHYHGNNVPNAYGDIRKFMEANEFDWMQGRVSILERRQLMLLSVF